MSDEVLIVDDDRLVLRALEATLKQRYRVHCANSGEEALALLQREAAIGVAIIDQRMPQMSGPELIRRTAEPYPHLVRIILTGYQDIHSLQEAINNGGAYRYLEKPCPNAELLAAVEGAFELHRRLLSTARLPEEMSAANERLRRENLELRREVEHPYLFANRIVGSSATLKKVLADAERVAASDTTVLIVGETGSGKELVARYVHDRSARRAATFRAQNCGAVAEQLMEDTLFGHVAGAFTGARTAKKGLFEIADGGTLLLDEIGDCPLALQTRLLRVVEERMFHRLGDDEHAIRADVRLIAATNRDLERAVKAGAFREDLYYRLNVFCLRVPPLRERREDIAELARYFIDCFNERARALGGKSVTEVAGEALAVLQAQPFPGNVRELANLLERAWLYADDAGPIAREHLTAALESGAGRASAGAEQGNEGSLRQAMLAFKARHIADALARNDWNVAATARDLGVTRSSLYEEIKECGLQRPAGD